MQKYQQLQKLVDDSTKNMWIKEQKFLKKSLVLDDYHQWNTSSLKYIAGLDISFSSKYQGYARSSLCLYDYQKRKQIYQIGQYIKLQYPYVPSFLAFRQLPSLLKLINYSQIKPQLLLCDGNGIYHPMSFGIASHLGVLTNIPSIGCGKSVFYLDGLTRDQVLKRSSEINQQKGDYFKLIGKSGSIWGAAMRTSDDNSNPLIVSIGNRVSLKTSLQIVLNLCDQTDIPQPIFLADKTSRKYIKKLNKADILSAKQYKMFYHSKD